MGASTKTVDRTPSDIKGLRSQTANFLSGTPQQQPMTQVGQHMNPNALSGNSRVDQLMGTVGAVFGRGNATGPIAGGPQPQGEGPGGGGMPVSQFGIGSGMERMFANVGGAPAPQVNYVGDRQSPDVQQAAPVNGIPNIGFGSDMYNQLQAMFQSNPSMTQGGPMALGQLQMGGVPGTQSVDQLGGENSAFFKNMQAQLQPAFTQARNEGLAAATERSGNLTGSGFANRLGSSINRSLGDEQARLAEHAQFGIGQEMQRQMGMAQLGTQQNIAGYQGQNQRDLQTQDIDARLRLGGDQFNAQMTGQGADTLARLGVADQGNQLGMMSGNADRQQGAYNLMAQLMGQQNLQNQSLQQGAANLTGQLGEQRYGTDAQTASANAQRYMQMLLGMNTAGVAPPEVIQSGGIGSMLGGIGGTILGSAAGPLGASLGNKIGSSIFK